MLQCGKLETHLSRDQGQGPTKSDPENITKIDNILQSLSQKNSRSNKN